MSLGASGQFDRLLREIREARAQLPAEHRNLLAQIGTQEGVVEDWPTGVQDLFRSVQEVPPRMLRSSTLPRCGSTGSAPSSSTGR
jgi:hypothetical protein